MKTFSAKLLMSSRRGKTDWVNFGAREQVRAGFIEWLCLKEPLFVLGICGNLTEASNGGCKQWCPKALNAFI